MHGAGSALECAGVLADRFIRLTDFIGACVLSAVVVSLGCPPEACHKSAPIDLEVIAGSVQRREYNRMTKISL